MTARVSASVKGLGRSFALATGGFVAFEGVSRFLEDSVNAARDAGVAQRSLAAQIKASGDSFAANQGAIGKAELSLEKYGFTSEDSAKALTVLERGTGNITRAISLQGVAANLARAKNIDLASAANVLAKVFGGQETALRRAVPGLDKNAHGLQLIADAQQRLAGQAKAGTTEAEKFHAILHNTEVIVGTALLPTLNKYLGELGKWLDKMNRSGQLQKDVNSAVKTATGLFQDLKAIVGPLVGVFKALGDAVGGTKNELKLLLGLGIALKLQSIAGGFKTVGAEAETARGRTVAFGRALGNLPATVGTTIILEALINKKPVDDWLKSHHLGFATKGIIPSLLGLVGIGGGGGGGSSGGMPGLQGPLGTPSRGAFSGLTGPVPAPVSVPGSVSGIQNYALTAGQQRAIGLAADPSNLGLLRQQAAHDQAALEFAKKLRSSGRITNAKYVTEVTAYASDLQQTNATINGILQTAAQNAKDAATAAAEKVKAAAQAAAQKRADAQQALFDRLQFNVDKAGLTDTLQDDLKALQRYQAVVKQIIATQGSTLALQQQLLSVEMNIKGVQGQIASNRQQAAEQARQEREQAKQAAQEAAQRAKEAYQAAQARALALRNARQFRLLGLGPTGGALVPGTANLQKRLTGIRDAVKGTFLDTSKTGSELDHIAQILSGKFGAVSESVRSAIDQMYKDIRDKLKSHQGDQTKFAHLSSQGFVDSLGLNLTLAQRRAIEARFSTVGARSTVPAGSSGQFNAGIVIHGGVHMHGVQDVAGLENQITKRAKARPHTRRGA
jgi:hypothetical protein